MKTITLQDIKINFWMVDVANRSVQVEYQVLQDNGDVFQEGQAFFWETIPVTLDLEGNPLPNPDNWYQLPAQYSQTLTDITTDARAALLHIINE